MSGLQVLFLARPDLLKGDADERDDHGPYSQRRLIQAARPACTKNRHKVNRPPNPAQSDSNDHLLIQPSKKCFFVHFFRSEWLAYPASDIIAPQV